MDNKVLKVLKPVARVLAGISMALGIAAITFLILFHFADVFTIFTDDGTKYAAGFSYPGYQAIYSGFGNMIIQGYTEATFNIWVFLGVYLPLLGCLVVTVMLATNFVRKGTNLKKAITEGIVAIFLIFGAIIILNVDKLWIANASRVTGSYTNYYTEYLLPAINGELYFGLDRFPVICFWILLVAGLFKFVNCGVLLFQKYYARHVNKQSVEISK